MALDYCVCVCVCAKGQFVASLKHVENEMC